MRTVAPHMLALSLGRVAFACLTALVVGVSTFAYTAYMLTLPSVFDRPMAPETAWAHDHERRARGSMRVGMPFAARDPPPPNQRGCLYLERMHLEERFIRDDACFNRGQVVAIIKDLVLTLAAQLEAHNVTYFLESGTLLGAYRDRGVIAHDSDGDLAIDPEGYEYLRDHFVPVPTEYQLDVWGSKYQANGGRDDKISARFIHKASAIYVDMFVFHDQEDDATGRAMVGPEPSLCYLDCVECPPLSDGRKAFVIPRDWVYPLTDCEFEGHQLRCPAKPVPYLRHLYGERFMTPQ